MKTKYIEMIGTISGIIGAFMVALGMGAFGYPVFITSSFCLSISAYRQKNWNLFSLQMVFVCANILGIYTYILK
jgi:nicotinamide riboside transporter PnuC